MVATETEGRVEQYSGQVRCFCGEANFKGDSSRRGVHTGGSGRRQQTGANSDSYHGPGRYFFSFLSICKAQHSAYQGKVCTRVGKFPQRRRGDSNERHMQIFDDSEYAICRLKFFRSDIVPTQLLHVTTMDPSPISHRSLMNNVKIWCQDARGIAFAP